MLRGPFVFTRRNFTNISSTIIVLSVLTKIRQLSSSAISLLLNFTNKKRHHRINMSPIYDAISFLQAQNFTFNMYWCTDMATACFVLYLHPSFSFTHPILNLAFTGRWSGLPTESDRRHKKVLQKLTLLHQACTTPVMT